MSKPTFEERFDASEAVDLAIYDTQIEDAARAARAAIRGLDALPPRADLPRLAYISATLDASNKARALAAAATDLAIHLCDRAQAILNTRKEPPISPTV